MLKKILIIIGILIVVAGGAFAYLYTMSPETLSDITGGREIHLSDFFPFGQESDTTTIDTSDTTVPNNEPQPLTQLRQVYPSPVSGAQFFTEGDKTLIRFVEQSTGNIYETYTDSASVQRITNTTIPKVAEAIFVTKNSVLLRYVRPNSDLIETVYGNISTTTSTSTVQSEFAELENTFLFPNIRSLVVSPKQNSIFYTNEFETGVVGTVANPNGTNKTVAFESPLKEWVAQWPTSTTITLTTAPSARVEGFLYTVNPNTGAQKKIISGIPGLTTRTNNTISHVLYTKNSLKGGFSLNLLDVKTGTSTLLSFGQTLPEKCVWSTLNPSVAYCATPLSVQKGEYPDVWYRGEVSFDDALWRINVVTNETDKLVDLGEVSGRALDAIDLSLDPQEKYILFRNKTDFTLWSFAL